MSDFPEYDTCLIWPAWASINSDCITFKIRILLLILKKKSKKILKLIQPLEKKKQEKEFWIKNSPIFLVNILNIIAHTNLL